MNFTVLFIHFFFFFMNVYGAHIIGFRPVSQLQLGCVILVPFPFVFFIIIIINPLISQP